MIRLPNFQERAKIATPNKAGTLKGVSPFSSVRNVMAKVQDTSSFIEAARAIHGDRYDYSRTDYVGAGKPITIVCRKHGEFTLGSAASHYMKKRSGCQECSGCKVRVRDTDSFITESRLVHGDTYDYSQTEYKSSDGPIVIVCRKCGPFTLKQTHSHYRKNKPCGCRTCERRKGIELRGRLKTCLICKSWLKNYPGTHKRGMCIDCWSDRRHWVEWSSVQFSKLLHEMGKRERTKDKWWSFAIRKYGILRSNRFRSHDTTPKSHRGFATWEHWARNQQITNHMFRKERTAWELKAKAWARTLVERQRKHQT